MQKRLANTWVLVFAATAVACNLQSGSGGAPVPLHAGNAAPVSPVDLSVNVSDAPMTGALVGTVVDENGPTM